MDIHLIIGRFQGVTKKHKELIQMSADRAYDVWTVDEYAPRKTIIGIVHGAKSSEYKTRNPFTFIERVDMLRKIFPCIVCIKLPTGWIGDAVEICHGLHYDIKEIFSGSDRDYGTMIAKSSYYLDRELFSYHPTIDILERKGGEGFSGTEIRRSLRESDWNLFRRLSPKELHFEYKRLKRIYKERQKITV